MRKSENKRDRDGAEQTIASCLQGVTLLNHNLEALFREEVPEERLALIMIVTPISVNFQILFSRLRNVEDL